MAHIGNIAVIITRIMYKRQTALAIVTKNKLKRSKTLTFVKI